MTESGNGENGTKRFDYGPHNHRFSNGELCTGRLRFYQAKRKWVIHGSTQKFNEVSYNPDFMLRCDKCGLSGVLVDR
jgi:hypothetical protein